METRRIVLGAQRIPGRIQRQRVLIREVRTPSLAVNQLGGDIALAVYLANLNRRSGRARQAWIEENNNPAGKTSQNEFAPAGRLSSRKSPR